VRGNVWFGDGVDFGDLAMDTIREPAVVGNYCKLGRNAQIGPHAVLATDGIRINYPDSWVQVIPDGDEPVVHVYTEAQTSDAASALEGRLVEAIELSLSRIAKGQSETPTGAHKS